MATDVWEIDQSLGVVDLLSQEYYWRFANKWKNETFQPVKVFTLKEGDIVVEFDGVKLTINGYLHYASSTAAATALNALYGEYDAFFEHLRSYIFNFAAFGEGNSKLLKAEF